MRKLSAGPTGIDGKTVPERVSNSSLAPLEVERQAVFEQGSSIHLAPVPDTQDQYAAIYDRIDYPIISNANFDTVFLRRLGDVDLQTDHEDRIYAKEQQLLKFRRIIFGSHQP